MPHLGFFVLDPMYFVFVGPAMLLAMWAQWRVSSAYATASEYASSSGASGAETAALMLRKSGINNVRIERSEGWLSDHYDPTDKVVRLSPDVYSGRNVAALGIAAHEVGHAIQDANGYPFLVVRNGLVPLASWGGMLSWILITIGAVMASLEMLWLGVAFFGLTVVFQIVNLPVEFDASRRAKQLLPQLGLTNGSDEDRLVRRVLGAAAMTYVAATLSSALTLLYYLWRLGLLGGSSNRDEG